MKPFKAVFSDIDGTLLNDGHRVTPATARRIRSLARGGVPFILVSARMPSGIFPIQPARAQNRHDGPSFELLATT